MVKHKNYKVASLKQLALIRLKDFQETQIIINGAIRSGKTTFAIYGFAELICELVEKDHEKGMKGYNKFLIANQSSQETAYNNVTTQLINYLIHVKGYQPKLKGLHAHNYELEKNGKEDIILVTTSFNNSTAFKQIVGMSYRSIFLDEAPLMTIETIEICSQRCIQFQDYKIVHTGNPEGNESHPYYKKFIEEKLEDKAVIKFDLLDNPIFTQKTIDRMKKTYTEAMFMQKILGHWVSNQGACFPNKPKLKKLTGEETFDFINMGLDYGEVDATTVVAIGWIGKNCYFLDEYYHKNKESGRPLTILEYKTEIAKWIKDSILPKFKTKGNITLFTETSPSSVFNLFNSDKEIPTQVIIKKVNKGKKQDKSQSAIQERINAVNILLNKGRLYFQDDKSELYKALRTASYNDKGERIDNGKYNIDSLDAFEYSLSTDIKYIFNTIGSFYQNK